MKKLFTILFIASMLAITSFSQSDIYKKVAINVHSLNDILNLQKLGIIEENPVFGRTKETVEVFINEKQLQILKENGYTYSVLIDNWKEYYSKQNKMSKAEQEAALKKSFEKYGVKGWGYGSMGGFLTADEVYQKLDEMHADYPNITTAKFSIGTTIEGDSMYVIKISDNPEIDEDEPEVFFHSLIHAREPAAMMAVLYYIYYLLDNYGTDPEATYLVNNRQIYYLPVFNVDGYKYNQSTDPDGGGMWRKNRRQNSDGSYGIDLNRNWGYMWGYDDEGSSGDPSSQTYRGTAPFSEPETENVRQFCDAHNFVTTLSYHSYSDLLILPWGYIPEETPDSLLYREYARDMTQYNHYTWGISSDIIYAVNGDSDDWLYGEQTEKNKIIVMTPEVGSSYDGFWPPQSRILPLAEENLFMNKYITWVAGEYINTELINISSQYVNPGELAMFKLKIRNKGLGDASNVKVEFSPLTENISFDNAVIEVPSVPAREEIYAEDTLKVLVGEGAQIGGYEKILAKVYLSDVNVINDTISLRIGTPVTAYNLDATDMNSLWEYSSNSSQHWEETTTDYVTRPNSYTDSKNGEYQNSISNSLVLKDAVNLGGLTSPFLSFYAKWDIEAGWDAVKVSVSTDNGSTWMDLSGKYTKPASGNGAQVPENAPIYDGVQEDWILEEMDLSQFIGQSIKLRFKLASDSYVTGDGFYVDGIRIKYYMGPDFIQENEIASKFELKQNYPNPFNPTTNITYVIARSGATRQSAEVSVQLKVYDILGREVATLVNKKQKPGKYSVQFDASSAAGGLPSGIYFYTIKAGNFTATKKMVLMK